MDECRFNMDAELAVLKDISANMYPSYDLYEKRR